MISQAYIGVWIDWSRGRLLGATLTLTSANGALMIAFLALFVRLAGSNFWNIVCFIIHQACSTRSPRDALRHQQQVIFRNASTDTQTIWHLLKINWAWGSKSTSSFGRRWAPVLLALLHFTLFAAAGIFSARVSNATHDLLIKSTTCGLWPAPPDHGPGKDSFVPYQDWRVNNRRVAISSSQYAQACYNTTARVPECNIYPKRSLDFTIDKKAPCPFNNKTLCDGIAIKLDTGHMDSHEDLGINAPSENRVTYRRVMSCTPIFAGDYSTIGPGSNNISSEEVAYYYFGKRYNSDGEVSFNYTYSYSNMRDYYNSQIYTLTYVSSSKSCFL
jgi:hypothetical protein